MLGRRFICPIGPATQREFILDWRIFEETGFSSESGKIRERGQGHGATAPKAHLVPSALPTYEVRQLQDELCMAIVTNG